MALRIDQLSGPKDVRPAFAKKLSIPARIAHKADFLRIRLIGDGEAQFAREGARCLFIGQFSKWKIHPLHLSLIEHIKHVALIFAISARAKQAVNAGAPVPPDTRVVAGSKLFAAKLSHSLEQKFELDGLVALHAWIGGAAGGILVAKILDHVRAKLFAEVHYVMGNAKHTRYAASIFHRSQRAATGMARIGLALHP